MKRVVPIATDQGRVDMSEEGKLVEAEAEDLNRQGVEKMDLPQNDPGCCPVKRTGRIPSHLATVNGYYGDC